MIQSKFQLETLFGNSAKHGASLAAIWLVYADCLKGTFLTLNPAIAE